MKTQAITIMKGETRAVKKYCSRCSDITSHTIKFIRLDEKTNTVIHYSVCNYCIARAKIKFDTVPEPTKEVLPENEFYFLWTKKLYDD